jgi:FeS assembly SUF system regulator
MIRLSRLSDYAVLLLTLMARGDDEEIHTAQELSQNTRLPAPTVSKILATLAKGDILESVRGRQGGYRLAQTPASVSVEDIIAAVDGPIALTLCVEHGPGNCDVEQFCPSSMHWHRINTAIRRALGDVTLADLLAPAVFPDAGKRDESNKPTQLS